VALMALTRASVGNVITAIAIAEFPRGPLVQAWCCRYASKPYVDAAVRRHAHDR
jgi:peptide/nickel transport system permease protein